MRYYHYRIQDGDWTIGDEGAAVIAVCFGRRTLTGEFQRTPLGEEASRQIGEYILGGRMEFSLPMRLSGTEFQRGIWRLVQEIPYGETRTYAELARESGRPLAARAVGQACGRNPVLLLVPCHRVVGADGALTGYAAGTALKKRLLDMEKGKLTAATGGEKCI